MRWGATLLGVLLLGCQAAADLYAPTAVSGRGQPIVVESANRSRILTAVVTPRPTLTPTIAPIAQVSPNPPLSQFTPLVPFPGLFPTLTPRSTGSPTPTLTIPGTPTPRPAPTLPTGPRLLIPTATLEPPATSTPRPTVNVEVLEETRVASLKPSPTQIPIDDLEPNDTPALATVLGIDEELRGAFISTFEDVDVFAIEVREPTVDLIVTVSGSAAYSVTITNPRGDNVGRQRFEGTTAVRSIASVGSGTGTYHVAVRSLGRNLAPGPYTIVATLALPLATLTPPGG
ncbi:MAG: hypothetical protein FJ033_00365 [Chloroflexi bacterium]|nr:hypothetical protein [Chloroflexota bacterium]